MMRNLCLLSLALAAAGCTTWPEITDRNLPEVVLSDTGGEIVAPPLGTERIVLRSFRPGPGGEGDWVEVTAAQCAVSVGPYTGVVTTPSRVVVPDLSPAAPPLVATCASGNFSGRGAIAPKSGIFGPYGNANIGMKDGK